MSYYSRPSDFALAIGEYAKTVKDKMNLVVRRTLIDIASRIDKRSPVGDPELWASNQATLMNRQMYSEFMEEKGKRISGKTIAKKFPLQSLKNYKGGQFRGNWQLGVDSRPEGETGRIDPTGAMTQIQIAAAIKTQAAGPVYFLVNNLPYAQRLEDGWSSQAPEGMVHLTIMEYQQIINEALANDSSKN